MLNSGQIYSRSSPFKPSGEGKGGALVHMVVLLVPILHQQKSDSIRNFIDFSGERFISDALMFKNLPQHVTISILNSPFQLHVI